MKMKNKIIPFFLFCLSIAFAIVSYVLLPNEVITQITLSGSHYRTMPKLVAIMIPFLLSGGFSIAAAVLHDETKNKKYLLVSFIGILVYIVMLVVNLTIL